VGRAADSNPGTGGRLRSALRSQADPGRQTPCLKRPRLPERNL